MEQRSIWIRIREQKIIWFPKIKQTHLHHSKAINDVIKLLENGKLNELTNGHIL
jgi:hypothetical protein